MRVVTLANCHALRAQRTRLHLPKTSRFVANEGVKIHAQTRPEYEFGKSSPIVRLPPTGQNIDRAHCQHGGSSSSLSTAYTSSQAHVTTSDTTNPFTRYKENPLSGISALSFGVAGTIPRSAITSELPAMTQAIPRSPGGFPFRVVSLSGQKRNATALSDGAPIQVYGSRSNNPVTPSKRARINNAVISDGSMVPSPRLAVEEEDGDEIFSASYVYLLYTHAESESGNSLGCSSEADPKCYEYGPILRVFKLKLGVRFAMVYTNLTNNFYLKELTVSRSVGMLWIEDALSSLVEGQATRAAYLLSLPSEEQAIELEEILGSALVYQSVEVKEEPRED